MTIIDTCGLSCPQPLLLTKQAIAEADKQINILYDSASRASDGAELLNKAGYSTKITARADDYLVEAVKNA